MSRTASAAAAFCGLVAVSVCVAQTSAPSEAEIERLVKLLGSDRYSDREAAMRKLVEIGLPAVPALRKAAESPDLEVSLRAKGALGLWLDIDPEARRRVLTDGQKAFQDARYNDMAAQYARLCAGPNPNPLDVLWLGHAHQLADDWPGAIAAYERLLALLDEELKPKDDTPPPREGKAMGASPVAMERAAQRREELILLIGRVQREQLKDLKAAAATFQKGAAVAQDHRLPVPCLRELALTQERMDQPRAALETWARVFAAVSDRGGFGLFDVLAVGRCLQALPGGAALPELPGVVLVTPEKSERTIDLDDPQVGKLAYHRTQPFWQFALAAPPGEELDKIDVACDIEETDVRFGGQFRSWVLAGEKHRPIYLGQIDWPRGQPAGRQVCRRELSIPPGAGLVFFETGSSKDAYAVHSVQLRATFRRRAPNPPALTPPVWNQYEALPPGGQFTRNGQAIRSLTAVNDLQPGKYAFLYELPEKNKSFRRELEFLPGRRYGLFINLDSPFRPQLTGLEEVDAAPLSGCAGIAPLPDGRFLAAYSTPDHRIMLATTKDLLAWDAPWPLPQAAMFRQTAPALFADAKGTVWLAYFCDRLQAGAGTIGNSHLWLAGTRDGKNWSKPRPVSLGEPGFAAGAVCMLRAADNRCWMFWRNRAAAVDDVAEFRELSEIAVEGLDISKTSVCNTHVSCDSAGRLHMLFDAGGQELWHATSRNGVEWDQPVKLMDRPKSGQVHHGQMLLEGEAFALLYEQNDGAFLRRGSLKAPSELTPAIKITNHVAPLSGARLLVTKEGKAMLLAGSDTVWLLQADKADVVNAPRPE